MNKKQTMKIYIYFSWIMIGLSLSIQAQDLKLQKEQKKTYSIQDESRLEKIVPPLVDKFIGYVKVNEMDKIWNMIDIDVQKIQTKEDVIKIFEMYKKYYGKIVSYSRTSCGMSYEQLLVSYDIVFEKYKGKAEGAFKVYDKDTVKMIWFKFLLDNYTYIDALDSIGKPIIKAIKAKDKKQFYDLTSPQFKENSPLDDIIKIDITEMKMMRQQLDTKDGNECVIIYYDLNNKTAYIQLSFIKQANIFKLDEFDAIILKK